MIDKQFMLSSAADFNINIDDICFDRLDKYAQLLVEWNEKMNLTGITEPREIAIKHFLDSLIVAKYMNVSRGTSLIDVGTGAGFPGVPLKILNPDINLTLLDSLNKRLIFLNEVMGSIELEANIVHMRAEDGGKKPDLRQKYDHATARAVAHLRELCEYCLPFVKVGGSFIALKGANIEEELAESKNAIKTLGGSLSCVEKLNLPGGDGRSIVIIKKISQTPPQFPRSSAVIAKKPIK